MRTITYIEVETASFTWRAVGRDEAEARAALDAALDEHERCRSCSPGWRKWVQEDATVLTIPVGGAMRDHDLLAEV